MKSREQMAEDYGYYHWTCRDCGKSGWTDTTPDCSCAKEHPEPEEDQFRCDNCGEIFQNEEKTLDEEFAYCPICIKEFRP